MLGVKNDPAAEGVKATAPQTGGAPTGLVPNRRGYGPMPKTMSGGVSMQDGVARPTAVRNQPPPPAAMPARVAPTVITPGFDYGPGSYVPNRGSELAYADLLAKTRLSVLRSRGCHNLTPPRNPGMMTYGELASRETRKHDPNDLNKRFGQSSRARDTVPAHTIGAGNKPPVPLNMRNSVYPGAHCSSTTRRVITGRPTSAPGRQTVSRVPYGVGGGMFPE